MQRACATMPHTYVIRKPREEIQRIECGEEIILSPATCVLGTSVHSIAYLLSININMHRRAGRRLARREHIIQKLAKELEGCELGNHVGGFTQAD